MKYRQTDDGKIRASEIGIGTYALAGVYGRKDPGEFTVMLRRAFDLGVTLFDTAPVYGDAEEVLGKALGDVRGDMVISTKVAAGLGTEFSCSFENVVASCEQSLRRLNTDYIDLYQIHFDDGRTPIEEVVRAFDRLKDSGKIIACGIGHVAPDRAGEYARLGTVSTIMGELSAVSVKYYDRMLPLARAAPASYIGFSLTGRKILTGSTEGREDLSSEDIRNMDPLFTGEKLKSALRIKDHLATIGSELGGTPAQIAIAWALSRERVLSGLIGPSSVAHLEDDLGAAELVIPSGALDEFDTFLAREGARLADSLRAELTSLLREEIADSSAGPGLIYAIEGLSELDLAPEGDLVPKIKAVLKAIKAGDGDIQVLDGVRKDLLQYVDRD